MGSRSESSLASLLLVNRLTDQPARPLTVGEFWSVVRVVEEPARLLGRDAAAIAGMTGRSAADGERIAGLLDAATQLAFQLERMQSSGYRALTAFDEDYPARLRERLGDQAPPVLFAVGPTELLSAKGLGIVGARDVSADGEELARQAARLAVEAGLTVVSGGAKGVDQRSMAAAFQAGGTVVGILADSLERRVKDPDTRRAIAEGRVCLVTPYKPSAGFSVQNAMGRNKLIYALAEGTFVVASDAGRGGTWEGAVEALRRGYGDVAVWLGSGSGPGNPELVDKGARGITDLSELLAASERGPSTPRDTETQLRLGL